ncbi:hypothetical protein DPMN_119727 [Dreissena polymorpha]|uniref:Uncharacterized protein n=1 Tax=Dreissena polymorpha TaxID=45954 RepID=A0A9D4GIN5_DREPO|nr:hypothetical protein DPMN_119727 [Dreissena polymorpha]
MIHGAQLKQSRAIAFLMRNFFISIAINDETVGRRCVGQIAHTTAPNGQLPIGTYTLYTRPNQRISNSMAYKKITCVSAATSEWKLDIYQRYRFHGFLGCILSCTDI